MEPNHLYYGDCLDWMRQWDAECVDLIYLDPPFNSAAKYNVLFADEPAGGKAQYRAFNDTWHWDDAAVERYEAFENALAKPARDTIVGLRQILGKSGMLAYLTYMAERLIEMRRLLKPTGSLYLHCDPTASHYLKIVMDAIFGKKNFRNELVWSYRRWPAKQQNFQRMHDVIFRYSKTDKVIWNQLYEPLAESTLKRFGGKQIVSAINEDGQRDPSVTSDEKSMGPPMRDVWNIGIIAPAAKERLGYPTQKPLALLERIIKASSNEGDIVLDPFCGCGTSIDAARRLNRRWAGIDISSFAIDLIRKERFKNEDIPAKGIPRDMASARKLAREKPFDFESWAVMRLPGFAPNMKQTGDGGVDGRAALAHAPDGAESRLALAQVKGGRFSLSHLRDFSGVMERDQAALGYYITLDPVETRAARAEAREKGKIAILGAEYERLQLWSIHDYFERRLPNLPQMLNPYTGKELDQTLALF